MPGSLMLQFLGGFIMLMAVFARLGVPIVLVGVAIAVAGLVEMSKES